MAPNYAVNFPRKETTLPAACASPVAKEFPLRGEDKELVRDFLRAWRSAMTSQAWWEAYASWWRGGNGWDRTLASGGHDTQAALTWFQFIHKPGSKEWRPPVIVRALLKAAREWQAACASSALLPAPSKEVAKLAPALHHTEGRASR